MDSLIRLLRGGLIVLGILCLVRAIAASAADKDAPASEGLVSISDGKTLNGWEGSKDVFRIEDGAIVGGSTKKALPRNEFLCTTKDYGDFELRLKFKLIGKDVNGGIQIRSRRVPNHNEVSGYQADLGQNYWGSLYDESRRNKILAQANLAELKKVLKMEDWNEYRILCQGRRIQLWVNGLQTVDYTEADEKLEQKGIIGLQIHSGPASEAWYKEITIRPLDAAK